LLTPYLGRIDVFVITAIGFGWPKFRRQAEKGRADKIRIVFDRFGISASR